MSTMTVRAPERSLAQRRAALERANRTRTYRARFKAALAAGERDWREAFDDELMASMKVYDLLLAVPRVGRVKANVALRRAVISPSKSVAGLTERQRRDLSAALPPRRPHR